MRFWPRGRAGDGLGVPGVTTASAAVRRASNPALPNRLWIADLAPLSIFEQPLYIGAVLDCCSRRCLGWRFSAHLDPNLITEAVEEGLIVRAPFDRRPLGRPIALGLAERCAAADLGLETGSLEARDRQVSRDFFDWLHADLLVAADWRAPSQARSAIGKWILATYNPAVASPPIPPLVDPAWEDPGVQPA
jgi:transposase InsO family protein